MQEFQWKLGLKDTLEACWQPWDQAPHQLGSSAHTLERTSLGSSTPRIQYTVAILVHLRLSFQSPTWTRRLTYYFPRFSRASGVLLIPINWPINPNSINLCLSHHRLFLSLPTAPTLPLARTFNFLRHGNPLVYFLSLFA
jgi:hypothetical protein